MQKLIFHSTPGPKTEQLLNLLKAHWEAVFVSNSQISADFLVANNLAEEDQETLIIAFPEESTQLQPKELLTNVFLLVQKFVAIRMKKRFGQILFLLDANANGLAYGTSKSNSALLAAQAGLVGLSKTVSKEYSKRGIINNVLYIDWQTIPLEEVASRANSLLTENTHLKGQVFALDGGRWL
jgi:NAD(P)-dependent dehydrogenase (short-subunit alcohol dehydrogenase family)